MDVKSIPCTDQSELASRGIFYVGGEFVTEDGRPIGIGGDPRGATAEKGRIILETSARELIPALLEIRDWK